MTAEFGYEVFVSSCEECGAPCIARVPVYTDIGKAVADLAAGRLTEAQVEVEQPEVTACSHVLALLAPFGLEGEGD